MTDRFKERQSQRRHLLGEIKRALSCARARGVKPILLFVLVVKHWIPTKNDRFVIEPVSALGPRVTPPVPHQGRLFVFQDQGTEHNDLQTQ